MKEKLRKICAPILNRFETGQAEYTYQKSHRTILKIFGLLFFILCAASVAASIAASQIGGIFSSLVFLAIAVVCEIIAFLGSDEAVANIWKSNKNPQN